MNQRTKLDLYLKEKFRKAGQNWDVAFQLTSLRKKSGLSQKELAKRVGTSQQQISRLESPSYKGHSLSMLRRVADVLGATVSVEIQSKKQQIPTVVAETKAIYEIKRKDVRRRKEFLKFEIDFLKKEKVDIEKNFHILEALYKEALKLGIIPLKNPLDGVDVDLKIAKVVNRV